MLSTFTPLSERGRGRRYWMTATWFIVGAALGGAALGGISALGAAIIGALGTQYSHSMLFILGALFALGSAIDFGALGPALPHHPRQVDETWLRQFRRWFTAGGFGIQIGFGLATYIMTTGVYLTMLIGALSGSPLLAFFTGLGFGVVRGALVLTGSRITSSERLLAFHRRLESLREPFRRITAATLAACAVLAIGQASGVRGVATGTAAIVVAAAVGLGLPRVRAIGWVRSTTSV